MPVVVKTADETMTNDTTLQDDNHIFFAVGANEKWAFELFTLVFAHATPDLKFGFTAPTGATVTWARFGIADDEQISNLGDTILQGGGSTLRIISYRGLITNGSNAGTFQLQFAQNTSNANATTMKAGTYLIAHEIGGTTLTGGTIIKSSDETIQSSTTYQSDNELHFNIAANATAVFALHILFDSGTTPDIKWKLFGPTGSSIHWQKRNTEPDYQDETDEHLDNGAGAVRLRAIVGIIINGSTAGEFTLKWAQRTSDASDTTVKAGSALIYHTP